MSDGSFFQQHFHSMQALGRKFQLGQLYDFRTDQIITGNIIYLFDLF